MGFGEQWIARRDELDPVVPTSILVVVGLPLSARVVCRKRPNFFASVKRDSSARANPHDRLARDRLFLGACQSPHYWTDVCSQTTLNALIVASQFRKLIWKEAEEQSDDAGEDAAEALPRSIGLSNDATSLGRGIARTIGHGISSAMRAFANAEDAMAKTFEGAKDSADRGADLDILIATQDTELDIDIRALERSVRELSLLELDLYTQQEELRQLSGKYLAAITKGERLLNDLYAYRMVNAEQITQYRYEDIAYRLFRNDALQKYRAQFDLAAQYTYLAAKAYGYETNLLDFDSRSGERLLEQVVRERVLGQVDNDGTPLGNSGLAGVLRVLNQNFAALKPLLGFNNPVLAADKFSLRRQYFRISPDAVGDQEWREALWNAYVPDLRGIPEYNQFFQHFRPSDDRTPEPALVFDFGTKIDPDLNFFGWEGSTLGGDSFYLPTYFAIRIREAGVFFQGYDDSFATGLAETPATYLGPIGADVMRVPNIGQNVPSLQRTREWNVIDQILPIPNILTPDDYSIRGNGWIPTDPSQLGGDVPLQPLTRKHSPFRASHDGVSAGGDFYIDNTFLVGRSVWNTRWLLVIPGRFLLQGDPDLGIQRFIDGATGEGMVDDILLGFRTYQYRNPLSGKMEDEPVLASDTTAADVRTVSSAAPLPPNDSTLSSAFGTAIAAAGELSEPPVVIYGRLENLSGLRVTEGDIRFEFTPVGGGEAVSAPAVVGALDTEFSFVAVVPNETGTDTSAGRALKLGGASYVPSVFFNDQPLSPVQMENPLTPARGRVIGPITYQVDVVVDTPTPTPTPVDTPTPTNTPPATPTPQSSHLMPSAALDVNRDLHIDEMDLYLILDRQHQGRPLSYAGSTYTIDRNVFMLFSAYWRTAVQ